MDKNSSRQEKLDKLIESKVDAYPRDFPARETIKSVLWQYNGNVFAKERITPKLDPSKPVGLVRELTPCLSIRTGKFGDYIFYKKPYARKTELKKPQFFKLNGFNDDYKKCDKDLLINWINQTYKLEL
jgi:hypothetical protein